MTIDKLIELGRVSVEVARAYEPIVHWVAIIAFGGSQVFAQFDSSSWRHGQADMNRYLLCYEANLANQGSCK